MLRLFASVARAHFALGSLVFLASFAMTVDVASAAPRAHLFFISANAFQSLLNVDPGLISSPLNSPNTSVAGSDNQMIGKPGLKVTARRGYRAFSAFQADSVKDIPEKLVLYNPENHEATPDNEARDPVSATRAFAALAHARGKTVIVAPSCNLFKKMLNRDYGTRASRHCVDAILVPLAQFVDIIDFELQSKETDPAKYEDLVRYAVAQIKASSPHTKVIVQLSTADRARTNATPETLAQEAASVADVVDGYFLFVGRTPDGAVKADQFLKLYFQKVGSMHQ
jgi:hypothetical protein